MTVLVKQRSYAGAAAGWCLCLCAALVSAQEFPSRPLRLVVGFPPGGGADGAARAVAQKLTESLGQAVVVDNRSGAGGNVAAEIVAHAVADGHTLLVTSPGPVVINPALYSSLPYDPQKELAPVTLIAAGANVLTVHPAVVTRLRPSRARTTTAIMLRAHDEHLHWHGSSQVSGRLGSGRG